MNLKSNHTIDVTNSNIAQVDKMIKIRVKCTRQTVLKKYYSVHMYYPLKSHDLGA